MAKIILSETDFLSETVSQLTNDEICIAIEEIHLFRNTGVIGDSSIRRIARDVNKMYGVPNDIRLVSDGILYEAARRFYNCHYAESRNVGKWIFSDHTEYDYECKCPYCETIVAALDKSYVPSSCPNCHIELEL